MNVTFQKGHVAVTCCNQTAKLAAAGVVSCNRCGEEVDIDELRRKVKVPVVSCLTCRMKLVESQAPIIYDDETGKVVIGSVTLLAPVYLCSIDCDKKLQEECR